MDEFSASDYRRLLPLDGKVFEVAGNRWRAELTGEPSLDEVGFFIDYEIPQTG